MRAVFLDRKTFNNDISLTMIEEQVSELVCYDTTTDHEVIERCKNADVVITNKVALNNHVLQHCPQLKLVCITATGTNNVDLVSAAKLKIAVTNVAGYAKQSVTQYVFSQILEYYNQTSHHNNNVEKGLWQNSDTFCLLKNNITEVADKTLGIIGYGNLGRTVETIAKAFGMNVMIAERQGSSTIREHRYSFDDVLQQADIVTLHCPQTPATQEIINKNTLALMKPSAMLINTSRGAVINNQDLLTALTDNKIAYAALDVLDCEPPPADHILLANQPKNLKVTAHIAWASSEAQARLLTLVAKNINAYKNNERFNRVES
jgi:glycerate dehydrogenase